MAEIKEIKIQNLLLDVDNYRIGHQEGQPQSIKAIVEEQGLKLVELAKSIQKNGLSPIELLLVTPVPGKNNLYVVIEGSRRVSSIKLVNNPALAAGTDLEEHFKKLHIKPNTKLPETALCVVVKNKEEGKPWIRSRHDRELKGAGLETWSSTAKDRADADAGKVTPAKDVREFIINNADLPEDTKAIIGGSKFNNTNLTRLLGTAYILEQLEIKRENGTITSTASPQWVLQVLTEMVNTIATKKYNDNDWSEADIDKKEQRIEFYNELEKKYPKPLKKSKPWGVNGTETVKPAPKPKPPKPTPSPKPNPDSPNRDTLIPKSFTLTIPDGKTNNIYHELRRLPLEGKDTYANAVAVLLRVFIENSVTHYIEKNKIILKIKGKDKSGQPKKDEKGNILYKDTLHDKITAVIEYLEQNNLVKAKELDAVKKELNTHLSILSVATLNAYVHNATINPKPLELKLTWDDLNQFLAKLWA